NQYRVRSATESGWKRAAQRPSGAPVKDIAQNRRRHRPPSIPRWEAQKAAFALSPDSERQLTKSLSFGRLSLFCRMVLEILSTELPARQALRMDELSVAQNRSLRATVCRVRPRKHAKKLSFQREVLHLEVHDNFIGTTPCTN